MRILVTCCFGDYMKSNIDDIRKKYKDVEIIGVDCRKPSMNFVGIDKFFEVPSFDNVKLYADSLLNICNDNNVDLIIPTSSFDLPSLYMIKDKLNCKIACDLDNGILLDNKLSFDSLCKSCGCVAPKTLHLVSIDSIDSVMDEYGIQKMILKDAGSKDKLLYDGTDKDSARNFINSHHCIAQDYIDGDEYSVDVFCKNGNIAFSVCKRNYDMNNGTASYSEIVLDDDVVSECLKICNKYKLDGLIGFDLIKTKNCVYVLECNARPTATVSLVSYAGVNLYAHLIEYYMTGDTVFDEELEYGCKIARFRTDYFFKEVPQEWKM